MKTTRYSNRYGASPIVCCDTHSRLEGETLHVATIHSGGTVGRFLPVYFGVDSAEPSDEPCRACAQLAEIAAHPAKIRAALLDPALSHTRDRGGFVTVYHYDDSSPTGVRAAGTIAAKGYGKLIAEIRAEGIHLSTGATSPLSPTEKR